MISRVHVLRNEALRRALAAGIRFVGKRMHREMEHTVERFATTQVELLARHGVDAHTPLRTYDAEVKRAVEAFAKTRSDVRFAYTSGSTREPKKIAFTPERLASIKRGSLSVVSRLMLQRRVQRPQLFILSGLKEDDSLSSLLLDGKSDRTPLLTGLLMPARYLVEPALAELIPRYGATAARLFVLVLANPGVLYSTNPSTLALFLSHLYTAWPEVTGLVRDVVSGDRALRDRLFSVMRAIASPGFEARFQRIAEAREPLPFHELAPAVELYSCWDGGYVRPFLEQIAAYLPRERYTHIPMYSMATETMQTLSYFDAAEVRFLPVSPDVLYEFLPEGSADDPRLLVPAHKLEVGCSYTMVVSDPYGLTRYHTEDLFACVGKVGEAPDLRFVRRRGLTFSFTGEKLTCQHVSQAFLEATELSAGLSSVQYTLVPSRPSDSVMPCYRLVLAPAQGKVSCDVAAFARAFDAKLGTVNLEYGEKRASGRLGPVRAQAVAYDVLAARLDKKTQRGEESHRGWDTQFKLLPLLTRTWEELGFDALD